MKLSDVKGERCLDVVADLIEPIANIADDKDAAELFKRKQLPKGKSVREFVIERIKKSMPTLLKNHKTDLIKIFATIKGVTEDEYRDSLTLDLLVGDVAELLSDDQFSAFFTSSQSNSE